MLRTQIEQLKDSIRIEYEGKIGKLKEEMDAALIALSKVEERLFNTKAIIADTPKYERYTRVPLKTTSSNKSIPERIKAALEKIDGEFTRRGLFQMTLDDGGARVANGSLASVFSNLINTNVIVAVKESSGKRPGVYKKAKNLKTQPESSPAV